MQDHSQFIAVCYLGSLKQALPADLISGPGRYLLKGALLRLFPQAIFPISSAKSTQLRAFYCKVRNSSYSADVSLRAIGWRVIILSCCLPMMLLYGSVFVQLIHIAALATVVSAADTQWKVGQTVQTSSGTIKGHAAKDADQVSEYLGIPYAQPPIDDLRFQQATRYNGTGLIAATSFGHACMQPALSLTGKGKRQFRGLDLTDAGLALLMTYATSIPTQSEDCLTLNVWTKPQTGEDKKAVMASRFVGTRNPLSD